MKNSYSIRALVCSLIIIGLGTFEARAGLINWTNLSGGDWFNSANWSSHSVPNVNDAAFITNSGTYSVTITGAVSTATIIIGGSSGKQTLIYGTSFVKLGLTNSTVQANGVLLVTNQGLYGAITINPGGELQLNAQGGGLQLYSFGITNQGTLTTSNGLVEIGGGNGEITYITNNGLWQITGDISFSYGGGGRSTVFNSGTIRRSVSSGVSTIGMDLINLPSGTVDALSGTLQLAAFQTNILGGSFTATSPGLIKFSGNETDAGGAASGTGSFQFTGGTFYLRTNTIPNLKFVNGDVYVTGTTSFQQAGAITNLTLDGANLRGTNRIAGTVTVNAGNLLDTVTVQPTGQLLFTSPLGTQIYSCNLINQGLVNWSSNSLSVGNTTIVNNGVWSMTGDGPMNYGGGGFAYFTNFGTLQKTAGTGISTVQGVLFVNAPSGIIRASSGTLQMPNNYTNVSGEMQLAGGTLTAGVAFSPSLYMTGGKLDGTGIIGSPAQFDGGIVQPGPLSAKIQFTSTLTLNAGCTLLLDGTGTVPGTSYDQLSVAGTITNNNSILQVSSLPNVPVGTSFVIITNTSASSTLGAFNGLPENSPLTISGQPFRIHYSGGNGNDVILVRDSAGGGGVSALLSNTGRSNTVYRLGGAGASSTIYTIQASTNLLQWTNIGYATGDFSGNFIFTDTNAFLFRYRMYRTTN